MKHLMKKYFPKKIRPAFFFIAGLGCLNHMLYEWTGGNALAALFCPVSESVWEHLKLLVFPLLFWSVWNYMHKRSEVASYFYYRFLAALCGMLCIVAIFYTYTGVIGRHFAAADILIFFIGVWVSLQAIPWLGRRVKRVPSAAVTYVLWVTLILCFFVFTCFPPEIPLFLQLGTGYF